MEQSGYGRHVAVRHVDPRQADQDEQRRQHEEDACDDAAPGAMHEPADVRRELLRLGSGQQHAVVQSMQEAALGDPAASLDEVLMHDGNLPGRPSEADESELEPVDEGLAKAKALRRRRACGGGHWRSFMAA